MLDLLIDGVLVSIYGVMVVVGLVFMWGEDVIEVVSGDVLVCEYLQIFVGLVVLVINCCIYVDDIVIFYF